MELIDSETEASPIQVNRDFENHGIPTPAVGVEKNLQASIPTVNAHFPAREAGRDVEN